MRTIRIAVCLIVLCAASVARAQDTTVERLKGYHYGDDRAILDAVTKRVEEARLSASDRPVVARALAAILSSDASFDAKQFACRNLAFIGTDEQIPSLVPLLQDEQLAHYALMALYRIPGPTVNEDLRKALTGSKGRTRLEIINTLGDRHDSESEAALIGLLKSDDQDEASAAAYALAKMGDTSWLSHVEEAYGKASGNLRFAFGDALLFAARQGPVRQLAAPDVAGLLSKEDAPPVLRAGALRLQARDSVAVVPEMVKALNEDRTPRQTAAADLARSLPGPEITRRLCDALPTLSPHAKVVLVSALADRGDRSAAPAISALANDPDPVLHLAVVQALGVVGDAGSVPALLAGAASSSETEREAARSSLARLRDPAADQKLMALAGAGEPSIRAEAIQAIGQRRVKGSTATLMAAARSTNPRVSAAAARVLRDLSAPTDLPKLVGLLLAAPADNRPELADAVATVALRGQTETERSGVLIMALSVAQLPADRVELLGILRQVGGPVALKALRTEAADQSAEVRIGAIRELAEWPTDAPMPDLLRALNGSQDARQRALALRGYIRMIGLNENRTTDESLRLYRDAASRATSTDEKRLILGGLGKVHSIAALDLAARYLKEEELRAEAELAVVEIARSTAGAYREKTRAALEPIAASSPNEESRNRAKQILSLMEKYGDFVTAWEVSPSYQQTGVGYAQLFDMPFPPEQPARQNEVAWSLMPAGGGPDQPWLLDLLAIYPGEQKVAYLRTAVTADSARDLVLEMGSDDGIKVWCNGQVVHTDNTARAVAPGQDKIKLTLKPGRNDLLVKVTQNVMGWGACARFTNPDGSPATGLKFTVPSAK